MRISPKQLPAMYEWLRTASKSLSVAPPADRVRFKFSNTYNKYGQCVFNGRRDGILATITLTALNTDLHQAVETMAHEMCHVIQWETDAISSRKPSVPHGPKFCRLARRVCRELHLNPYIF